MHLERDRSTLSLAVVNQSGRQLSVQVRAEVLDPEDKVRTGSQTEATLPPGAGSVNLPISLGTPTEKEQDEALWYRLRYSVEAPGLGPAEGIVALAEVTPEIFELRVAAGMATPGKTFGVRVRAQHPVTQRPVRGVAINAKLEFEDDRKPLEVEGSTGADGYGLLRFPIPQDVTGEKATLTVNGRRAGFLRTEDSEIPVDNAVYFYITTDKPLYQPGQVLHARALLLDPTGRAAPGEAVQFSIKDPEGTLVYQASLTTSRFGIAQADWSIPENLKLGQYRVFFVAQNPRFVLGQQAARVRISRYELPNFTVNVTPDRSYYLPGQNAALEVSAEYLFGKPVARGHVRVVREEDRRWNFQEQRWEAEEQENYESDTDAKGSFRALVDLSKDQDDLKEGRYRRFQDVSYAAYFTDLSTGRTEQRRFQVRVTRDPIHVYLVGGSRNARKLPLEFYISTSYADGTPCQCEVTIREGKREDDAGPVLRTVKTNKYGVAKVSALELPPSRERYRDNYVPFLLRARDGQGAGGERSEEVDRYDWAMIRIATDKTLYRPGEPVKVELRASERNLALMFEVWNEKKLVSSQRVQLRGGKAFVLVPYDEQSQGELQLEAYSLTRTKTRYYHDRVYGSRTVLYPHDTSLRLGVKLSRGTYKPGEDAVAELTVAVPGGASRQAALGAVVFDKAVEERYRTDREFGEHSGYGFAYTFWDYWGYNERLGDLTRPGLNRLDISRPFAEDLDLAAEVLLSETGSQHSMVFGGVDYPSSGHSIFQKRLEAQFKPVRTALDEAYAATMNYPKDEAAARALLAEKGLHLDELRDPWGTPWRVSFHVERDMDVLELTSAGPDKKPGNEDDFTALSIQRPYFLPEGQKIDQALREYHARSGGFIRDAVTLKQELARLGVDSEALRDPWGTPYAFDFGVNNARFYARVVSAGPDKTFDPQRYGDDFILWTGYIEYFTETQAAIDSSLAKHFYKTGKFPENQSDFLALLTANGISSDKLRDGWGHSLYVTFNNEARYEDRLVMSYTDYLRKAQRTTSVTPITQRIGYIHLRSPGEDGKPDTADDFEVATFSRILAEQTSWQSQAGPTPTALPLGGHLGGIQGAIKDPAGAVISGATVKATEPLTGSSYDAATDATGHYELRDLPPADYTVAASSPGFRVGVVTQVPVRAGQMTELDLMLNVGSSSETVEVRAEAVQVNTENIQLSARKGAEGTQPLVTPRLRQYFPETLLWQPELVTDSKGRARMKFKLADNITTWKMSVLASTLDGQIGVAEKEFRAFQPFFLELDPPPVLTQGDEIALPVVLRNYLAKSQTLSVSMKPESWFTLLSPAEQQAGVAAGDSATASFRFRTVASIAEGKQRVTAANNITGDSVEKPVWVHPDGEEVAQTATQLLDTRTTLQLTVPEYVIPGTTRAELKLYPNLMDHVLESVEAILQRPYGCGEQTISSTYPNLMLLRLYKRMGKAPDGVYARSLRYAQMGYQRLLAYQDESGGFTYWGRGDPDLALTAYALRFLQDAAEFVPVDEGVVQGARLWLVRQQKPDGTWAGGYSSPWQTDSTTAYVLRALAKPLPPAVSPLEKEQKETPEEKKAKEQERSALARAFAYVSGKVEGSPDSYLLATFALAASEAGRSEDAARARERLAGFRHQEDGAAYWALETNTPFYGWGYTARIETTALAVQALVQAGDRKLADPGLLFLLRNQDRYGTWHSTQATVNVLDALMLLQPGTGEKGAASAAEVLVNGRKAASIALPGAGELNNPVSVDLSGLLEAGANRVEVARTGANLPATAQLMAAYYIPWEKSAAGAGAKLRTGDSDALRLSVNYDMTEGAAGAPVKCHVHAERIGHHGYGMLLAEVGLPPGADVDRNSLEAAVNNSGWAVQRYEVLPDRLIVYLWPRAGGTDFEFSFRPRYAMDARTAASLIYDYYNPEASAVIAPTRFVVH